MALVSSQRLFPSTRHRHPLSSFLISFFLLCILESLYHTVRRRIYGTFMSFEFLFYGLTSHSRRGRDFLRFETYKSAARHRYTAPYTPSRLSSSTLPSTPSTPPPLCISLNRRHGRRGPHQHCVREAHCYSFSRNGRALRQIHPLSSFLIPWSSFIHPSFPCPHPTSFLYLSLFLFHCQYFRFTFISINFFFLLCLGALFIIVHFRRGSLPSFFRFSFISPAPWLMVVIKHRFCVAFNLTSSHI